MGMIILIAFLILGICASIKAIFKPSTMKLDDETKKSIGVAFFLAITIPSLFTIWAALLIGTKTAILLTAAYLAWNIGDMFRMASKTQKAIKNGEAEVLYSPGYIRIPLAIVEITYLSYLVYGLYLLM